MREAGLSGGGGLRTPLKLPQPLFELPVAVLQFLVLAGELPELVLELLNAQLGVGLAGLRQDCAKAGDASVSIATIAAAPVL